MKARRNPYAWQLKPEVTITLDDDVIEYFRSMAEETGIPCQSLINLYLRDCVTHGRRPDLRWR